MTATSFKTAFLLFALLPMAVLACGEKNKGIKTGGPQSASAGIKDPAVGADIHNEDIIGKDDKLLHATYDINVVSVGMPVCKGDIELQVAAMKSDTAKLFDIPAGKVKCTLMGEIDLAATLGAFAGAETVKDPMVVANDVISLKQVGLGVYSPARPMMPSFIASSKEALRNLNYSKTVTVTAADGKTASGTSLVHTLEFGASYKPPRMSRTFNNVIHFEVINTGFNGVDKVTNMLFDRMEFRISLNPIAVLSIGFKGKAADYMAAAKNNPGLGGAGGGPLGGLTSGAGGIAGGGLFGMIVQGLVKIIDVEMKMDLVTQDGLEKISEESEDSGGTDGETISGKQSKNKKASKDEDE